MSLINLVPSDSHLYFSHCVGISSTHISGPLVRVLSCERPSARDERIEHSGMQSTRVSWLRFCRRRGVEKEEHRSWIIELESILIQLYVIG